MDKRDTIAQAASTCLASLGVNRITVARVAKAASVSSALVHYHFSTKRKLLAAAAEALARRRTDVRVAALAAGQGLASLDALWGVVADEDAGVERAALDLLLLAREDREVRTHLTRERVREQSRVATLLPRLLGGHDRSPRIPIDELAATVCTFLDGVAASLQAGLPGNDVRASYDAFWLALVALAPGAPAGR